MLWLTQGWQSSNCRWCGSDSRSSNFRWSSGSSGGAKNPDDYDCLQTVLRSNTTSKVVYLDRSCHVRHSFGFVSTSATFRWGALLRPQILSTCKFWREDILTVSWHCIGCRAVEARQRNCEEQFSPSVSSRLTPIGISRIFWRNGCWKKSEQTGERERAQPYKGEASKKKLMSIKKK